MDYVVVSRRGNEAERYHWQTYSFDYNPIISGDSPYRVTYEPRPLDVDKVIARRAVLELVRLVDSKPVVMNLDIGIPAVVADMIREDVEEFVHTTVESGQWGGYALTGADFGAVLEHYAVIPMPDRFLLYEEGAIRDLVGLLRD